MVDGTDQQERIKELYTTVSSFLLQDLVLLQWDPFLALHSLLLSNRIVNYIAWLTG
jgi:hypothetical protein